MGEEENRKEERRREERGEGYKLVREILAGRESFKQKNTCNGTKTMTQ